MIYFTPNISRAGRVVRASGAVLFAISAGVAWSHSAWVAIALGAAAAFLAFEAAKGWCAARACGIKTPL